MSARTAFELGWDYASFGILPPDGANSDMLEGNVEGKRHFGSAIKKADFMDRKWLQIRFNAIRRNRVFDDQVTPEFLAWILPDVCPISLVQLTVASMTDTDWSVDRIINDGGYTRHNLMIVSTRVNQAKGSKTLSDIKKIIEGKVIDQLLTIEEWVQLYRAMQDVYYHAGLISDEDFMVFPVDELSPPQIKKHYSQNLQHALIPLAMGLDKKNKKGKESHKELRNYVAHIRQSCNDPESRRLLHKVCTKMLRKLPFVANPSHVWLNLAIFENFLKLFNYQKAKGAWPKLLFDEKFAAFSDKENFETFCAGMKLNTRGYNGD
jgi:hypothetical protein